MNIKLRQQLIQEVELIPDDHLAEILNVLRYYRIGVESTRKRTVQNDSMNPSPGSSKPEGEIKR